VKELRGPARPTARYLAAGVVAVAFAGLLVIFAFIWSRDPIFTALGVVCAVALAGAVVVLAVDRFEALSDADAQRSHAAALEAALDVQVAEVRESRLRIITAGLNERRRMSRDLHDGLQGSLMAVNVVLAAARSKTTDVGILQMIDRARELVGQAVSELRGLVLAIYPNNLDILGLQEAIRTLVERLDMNVDIRFGNAEISSDLELELYFLVSEAMTNVKKHAHASHVGIDISVSDGMISVEITDDGVGGADPNGPGLTGLARRVTGRGGGLSISSPSGQGTTIHARIPCV
jgi:signal transduction histidine kinase